MGDDGTEEQEKQQWSTGAAFIDHHRPIIDIIIVNRHGITADEGNDHQPQSSHLVYIMIEAKSVGGGSINIIRT